MNANDKPKTESIDEYIKLGAEIVGSTASTVIGFFAVGLPGAILGSASGPVLSFTFGHVMSDIKNRFLGKREEIRIGATLTYTALKIKDNLNNGMHVREDDFFSNDIGNKPPAHEILEGILLASQREHEEKKLHFYGNLLGNIAFYSEIDKAQANLLIRIAESLSYRQMCLIYIFVSKENFNLRKNDYGESVERVKPELGALLLEIYDLDSKQLLNCGEQVILSVTGVNPSKMNVQGMGMILFELLELYKINEDDINPIVQLLQ